MSSNGTRNETYLPFLAERSSTEVIVAVIFYVLLSLLVITGNVLVIASYTLNPKLRKGITVFFVSLAISDLCVGLIPIPYWITALLLPFIRERLNRYFIAFDIFGALASIFNLVAISIERRIVLSAKSKLIFPCGRLRRLNIIMICIAWFVALTISVCWWCLPDTVARGLLVFLAGFVVPLTIMMLIYFDIYRLVRHTQGQITKQLTNQRKSSRCRHYEERKTAQTVVIITALFVIAWTPFFVCSMISTFSLSAIPKGKNQKRLIDFVKWMHYSSSAVNPFVYAYRNEIMRETMVCILHRVRQIVFCTNEPEILDVKNV